MNGGVNNSVISAVVLAAGSSSRMGAIKPLVPVGGKSMLDCVLAILRESHMDDILVVLGYEAEVIQQNVLFGDAKVVVNPSYRDGMASSLQTGLAHLTPEAEAALIVLADQPFLQPRTIDILIDEYRRKRPKIVIPIFNGRRGNPVLLDRSVFGDVSELKGDVGFRAVFGNHEQAILTVPVDDPGVLVDLDTAADVQRFERSISPR